MLDDRIMPEQPIASSEPFDLTFTQGIDKEVVRTAVEQKLREATEVIDRKAHDPFLTTTINTILSYQDDEHRKIIEDSLVAIKEVSKQSEGWRKNDFADPDPGDADERSGKEKFEHQIDSKSHKYQDTPDVDDVHKYLMGLGEEVDQAKAAGEVFGKFAQEVDSLQGISDQDRDRAAYFLAMDVRRYKGDIEDPEKRKKLVEDGKFSQDTINAILAANLVSTAEARTPAFNKEGFSSDDAWDKAVYMVATGVLEGDLVNKIRKLAGVKPDHEIYLQAMENYLVRSGQNSVETLIPLDSDPVTNTTDSTGSRTTIDPDPSNANTNLQEEMAGSMFTEATPPRISLDQDKAWTNGIDAYAKGNEGNGKIKPVVIPGGQAAPASVAASVGRGSPALAALRSETPPTTGLDDDATARELSDDPAALLRFVKGGMREIVTDNKDGSTMFGGTRYRSEDEVMEDLKAKGLLPEPGQEAKDKTATSPRWWKGIAGRVANMFNWTSVDSRGRKVSRITGLPVYSPEEYGKTSVGIPANPPDTSVEDQQTRFAARMAAEAEEKAILNGETVVEETKMAESQSWWGSLRNRLSGLLGLPVYTQKEYGTTAFGLSANPPDTSPQDQQDNFMAKRAAEAEDLKIKDEIDADNSKVDTEPKSYQPQGWWNRFRDNLHSMLGGGSSKDEFILGEQQALHEGQSTIEEEDIRSKEEEDSLALEASMDKTDPLLGVLDPEPILPPRAGATSVDSNPLPARTSLDI